MRTNFLKKLSLAPRIYRNWKWILGSLFLLLIAMGSLIVSMSDKYEDINNQHNVSANTRLIPSPGDVLKFHDDLRVKLSNPKSKAEDPKSKGDLQKSKLVRDTVEKLLKDNIHFRNYTLAAYSVFSGVPGAFEASLYFGLGINPGESEIYSKLMILSLDGIAKNSAALYDRLMEKHQIFVPDTFFHETALNLSNSLNVSAEKKLRFLSKTLSRSVELDSKGNLDDLSLPFETALILMKQIEPNASSVKRFVSRAIAANEDSKAKLQALKERVLTYYPDLASLF